MAAKTTLNAKNLEALGAQRAMIDFTLDSARSSRYKHAARHLAECSSLAPRIDDYGSAEFHDAYVADLKHRHGKKHGFWSLVGSCR